MIWLKRPIYIHGVTVLFKALLVLHPPDWIILIIPGGREVWSTDLISTLRNVLLLSRHDETLGSKERN